MSPWWKGLLEADVKAWLTLVVWVESCRADLAPEHDIDPLSSPPASASPCAAHWACHWFGERWTVGREKHELFTDAGGPLLDLLHGACGSSGLQNVFCVCVCVRTGTLSAGCGAGLGSPGCSPLGLCFL